MKARAKLDKLKRRVTALPAANREARGPSLAEEVQEIDREIKRLDAKIAEDEANMTPEELARHRAWIKEDNARFAGLSLDEHIQALENEIALLEAEE